MKLRMLLFAFLFITTTAFAETFEQAAASGAEWVTWQVPMAPGLTLCCAGQWNNFGDAVGNKKGCCSGCSLSRFNGFSTSSDSTAGSTGTMLIAARISDRHIRKVQLYDAGCALDTGKAVVRNLGPMDPPRSIELLIAQLPSMSDESSALGAIAFHDSPSAIPALERLAGTGHQQDIREDAVFWLGQRGGERGFRFVRDIARGRENMELRKKAIFSMSQSEVDQAVPELIALARNGSPSEIRRQAIFWLGQKAGEKAAGELRRAVDEDPDEDVREHAVFAISQLPSDRSVPLLIDLVRKHKSANVREKAMFWLSQTDDPRALALIEEILTK